MISEEKLLEVLNDWNLWHQDIETGIGRYEYIKEINSVIERKEIIVLKGIRRSGKSTIMRQIMKKLTIQNVDKKQLLYVNLEAYNLKDSLKLELFELILKVHSKNAGLDNKKIYFFIDEIQVMPEWERFLRTMYDLNKNIKFIISGSNASLLDKELSTLLTGRNLTFEIKPLTYSEYKQFTLKPNIDEYLEFGGFPEVVLEPDIDNKRIILRQYFEDIINKDVIHRNKIRNTQDAINLAQYLVVNSGTRFSINKLAKALQLNNQAIENYISSMIDAYLIVKVNHFSYSLKKRFDKMMQPKYYVADTGFLQIKKISYAKNQGKLLENGVLNQLIKIEKNITYWLEQNEVDFIASNNAVNVTVSSHNIEEREFIGLEKFKEKNKKFNLNLITKDKSYEVKKDVKIFSFEEFCKNIEHKKI